MTMAEACTNSLGIVHQDVESEEAWMLLVATKKERFNLGLLASFLTR